MADGGGSESDRAFAFSAASPERVAFEIEAVSATLPGVEGEFEIRRGHAPLIAALRPGEMRAEGVDGERIALFVSGGYVEVSLDGTSATALLDDLEPLESLDASRLASLTERAESARAAARDESAARDADYALAMLRDYALKRRERT